MNVVRKKKAYSKDRESAFKLAKELYPLIKKWANPYLWYIIPSGSYAKLTSIKGLADIDLFISLKTQMPYTLKEIYNSLYEYFDSYHYHSFFPRKQNVSIRIKYRGINVDLVPAKRMPNATYSHSIYVRKGKPWTKTNIQKHILIVRNSRRMSEIVLMKIWRELNKLDFPSFYLELSIIEALKGRHVGIGNLEKNIIVVFEYLIRRFQYARIFDPANSQNVISKDLSDSEKREIIEAAKSTLVSYIKKSCWTDIIW